MADIYDISPRGSYFMTVMEASQYLNCTTYQVEEYIKARKIRISNLPGHGRKRLVVFSDVRMLVEEVKNTIPVQNLPPINYAPMNCVLVRETEEMPAHPVTILPGGKYYVYVLCKPDGTPFYVGKGTGGRAISHLNEARNLDCICKKCRIIRHIWVARKEVKIDYVFTTDSEREALKKEQHTIRELSRDYALCNKSKNPGKDWHREKSVSEMTLDEYANWLRRQKISAKTRQEFLREWVERYRPMPSRKEITQMRRFETEIEVDRVIEEAEQSAMSVGLFDQGDFLWELGLYD